MRGFPINLNKRLETRKGSSSFRELKFSQGLIDFSSNDYLGFAGNEAIFQRAGEILEAASMVKNGSGGSRLLTGNHLLYIEAEEKIAAFHQAEAALVFNSGYDANLGFFSAVAQRGDVIIYDELIHASVRDGIRLSTARAVKFAHNDLKDLQKKIRRLKNDISGEIFLVTESVFSMDGDSPDLKKLAAIAEEHDLHLVVDEAHAVGANGAGLCVENGMHHKVFARLVTFGKALGAHGAAILGSKELKAYLVNFARSLIYSTSLPPHSIATIIAAYEHLENEGEEQKSVLQEKIKMFKAEASKMGFSGHFMESDSAVHCCLVPGNAEVKNASSLLIQKGFEVLPILSPTVPAGKERLRICLHSFNSEAEIKGLIDLLKMVLKKPFLEGAVK